MKHDVPAARTALLIVDLQNDFLDTKGAYGRGGQSAPAVAALPTRIKPLADALRKKGGWIVSTQFTLVPAKDGEPLISPHLKQLRPFLKKGDFLPGSWGHQLVDMLQPADLIVEKIKKTLQTHSIAVAYTGKETEFLNQRTGKNSKGWELETLTGIQPVAKVPFARPAKTTPDVASPTYQTGFDDNVPF